MTAGFAALAPCRPRLFRREFMRMAAGVRGTPAFAGNFALLFRIHPGETASLYNLLRVAALTLATSLILIVLASRHVVLLLMLTVDRRNATVPTNSSSNLRAKCKTAMRRHVTHPLGAKCDEISCRGKHFIAKFSRFARRIKHR